MKPSVPLALSLALSLAAAPVGAGSLPPGFDDNPTVVDAVAKARASGKPVIVYFSEHNCTACGALDGWLVRGDIRQAFAPGYHFSVVFGTDLVPTERERWRATYTPRGAPSWVVLAADGSYLCTATGGFANATAALELHKVVSRAVAKAGETRVAEGKVIEARIEPRSDERADPKAEDGPDARREDRADAKREERGEPKREEGADDGKARAKLAAVPVRPRPCTASALGV